MLLSSQSNYKGSNILFKSEILNEILNNSDIISLGYISLIIHDLWYLKYNKIIYILFLEFLIFSINLYLNQFQSIYHDLKYFIDLKLYRYRIVWYAVCI